MAALYTLGHVGTVIWVGGDFMVLGRYLVPLMPILALVAALGVRVGLRAVGFQWSGAARQCGAAGALLVLLGWGVHSVRTEALRPGSRDGMASIGWVARYADQGRAIGLWLKEHAEPGARIATTAAGTIPYYSQLHTLDLLGLNDAWVAHHVEPTGVRPGHRKRAPLSYVLEQDIDYVIDHPTITASPAWPRPEEREHWSGVGYRWFTTKVPDLEPHWWGCWVKDR